MFLIYMKQIITKKHNYQEISLDKKGIENNQD